MYKIGDWTFHPQAGELRSSAGVHSLEHRTAQVLEILCKSPNTVISQDTFINEVWQGRAVSEHSLAIAISALRKAIGDDARNPRFIQTVPKRGYRLILETSQAAQQEASRTDPYHLAKRVAMIAFLAMISGLIWWQSQTSAPPAPRLVLTINDIRNATRDQQSNAEAFAISELGASYLSRVPDIVVIRHWWKDDLPDPTGGILERYGAQVPVFNLTGSLIDNAGSKAVTLFLTQPETDQVIWSSAYQIADDVPLASHLSALGDMLVSAGILLNADASGENIQIASPQNPAYWLGQFYWRLGSEDNLTAARRLWENSSASLFDPFVQAGLAALNSRMPVEAATVETANSALDLDVATLETSPTGLLFLAHIALYRDRDPELAIRHAQRALILAPSEPLAFEILARANLETAHIGAATTAIETATFLDPFSPTLQNLKDQITAASNGSP